MNAADDVAMRGVVNALVWIVGEIVIDRVFVSRELLRRGLAAEGFNLADKTTKSKDFGLISRSKPKGRPVKPD
jgi:hypothetical protein